MENYVPVLTPNGRPLAPCHAKRARSLVRAGKAQFRHKRGIRCIVLTKTNVPKVKQSSELQLRIDPGSKHTGIAITRDHPDGYRRPSSHKNTRQHHRHRVRNSYLNPYLNYPAIVGQRR